MKPFLPVAFCLALFAAVSEPRAEQHDAPRNVTPDFLAGSSSGGRWMAALEAGDDPRTVLLEDLETGRIHLITGAEVTLVKIEWRSENELEIYGGGDSLVIEILPPDPDSESDAPRFRTWGVLPKNAPTARSGSGARTLDNVNYLDSVNYMKERLKGESYQRRGPRIPRNPD